MGAVQPDAWFFTETGQKTWCVVGSTCGSARMSCGMVRFSGWAEPPSPPLAPAASSQPHLPPLPRLPSRQGGRHGAQHADS